MTQLDYRSEYTEQFHPTTGQSLIQNQQRCHSVERKKKMQGLTNEDSICEPKNAIH